MSPRLPICQRYASFRVSASVATMMADSSPLNMYDRATPTRIDVAGLIFIMLDRAIRMNAGTRPQTNAFVTTPMELDMLDRANPVTTAMTAPKQAPSDMPVV